MDLYWTKDKDRQRLFVGCNETEIAVLYKAKKWWEAIIWLPGCKVDKRYGPLEEQRKAIEDAVQAWFGMANTSRPAMDDYETDY